MPDQRRRRFRVHHLLAPIALAAVAVAVFVVISNSNVLKEDDEGASEATTTQQTGTENTTTQDRRGRRQRRNYIVKPGDSFGAISEKTGVSVERLGQLNPEVDPQALVVGQRIKLRE